MILEAVELNIKPGQAENFEIAFKEAEAIISSINGYINHQLQKCIETKNQYLLLVEWETLEAHTVNFRQSDIYQEWKNRLHHFYAPFPTVKHYQTV